MRGQFGWTVLVAERDERVRTAIVAALRHLGLRALGVVMARDALALLDGIDADVVLVRGDDDGGPLPVQARTRLVRLAATASVEETVVELLRALGRPDEAAQIN